MHAPRIHFVKILLLVALLAIALLPSSASAQVRTKKPDRGVYRSPVIGNVMRQQPEVVPEQTNVMRQQPNDSDDVQLGPPPQLADLLRSRQPNKRTPSQRDDQQDSRLTKPRRELVEVPLTYASSDTGRREAVRPKIVDAQPKLQRVSHEEVQLVRPNQPRIASSQRVLPSSEVWSEDDTAWTEQPIALHDGTCDGCPDCNSCDFMGCDTMGCDSIGCCQSSCWRRWCNGSLCLNRDQWFGAVELLLMFRKGDHLPPLVTTGPDVDPDTAGELGQAGTVLLVGGGGSVLKDVTAGGRFTLGTWIDSQQCRSLVLRGWFAGEETFGFNANQNSVPVIARPFLNVSDNQAAAQDTQLVAFPNRVSGSISVNASSEVYGADFQVRQFWYGRYGATIDLLYGYQFMRLSEDLGISNTSTSENDDFAPIGSVISVTDVFDAESEFHGGQFGMASRYREGCWSFNSLLKIGFGSLQRRARRSGSTLTSIDGANAVDANGLLVRGTNSGTFTDHTFGWVPELDLSLGWQRYPCFDVTVGYHIIAMTDALQVSGTIDQTLASNLTDPPTGQQRPSATLRYKTFYVQGIHFGLQYVY